MQEELDDLGGDLWQHPATITVPAATPAPAVVIAKTPITKAQAEKYFADAMARCVTKTTKLVDENNPAALQELKDNLAVIDEKIWFLESYLTEKRGICYSLLYFLRRVPGLVLPKKTRKIAEKLDTRYPDAFDPEVHIEKIHAFLQQGMSPRVFFYVFSIEGNRTDVINMLVDHCAEGELSVLEKLRVALVNTKGQGPLVVDAAVIKKCFSHDMMRPLDYQNAAGYSLYYLITHHPDLSELLKDNVNITEYRKQLDSVREYHWKNIQQGDVAMWESFVKRGVFSPTDLNFRDNRGCTLLHLVKLPEMAEYLLNNGADLFALNNDGHTPKEMQKDNPAVLTVLIAAQKKLEATYQEALEKRNVDDVRACVTRGVRVSTTDLEGVENPELQRVLEEALRTQETHFRKASLAEYIAQRFVSDTVIQELIAKKFQENNTEQLNLLLHLALPLFTPEQLRALLQMRLESKDIEGCVELVEKGVSTTVEQQQAMMSLAVKRPNKKNPHDYITRLIDVFGMSSYVEKSLIPKHSPRIGKAFLDALVDTWHAAFFEAVENNKLDTVRDFIARGFDIRNAGTKNIHCSPLVLAPTAEMAELLIEHGADVDGKDFPKFSSPLSRAIAGKRVEVVRCLLNHGADVTPQFAEIIDQPISSVFKLNQNDPDSNTIRLIMFDACNKKFSAFRDALFSNPTNRVVLHILEINGQSIIEALCGCPNREGIGLLAVIRRNNKDLTRYPNIRAVARKFDEIFVRECLDDPTKIKYFLDLGCDSEALSPNGNTLLHICAARNNLDGVKLLIKLGANIFAKNAEGRSVLECSDGVLHSYLLAVIKERHTAFRQAIKAGNVEALNNYLNVGNDVDAPIDPTDPNSTPLKCALRSGRVQMVTAVLIRKPNITPDCFDAIPVCENAAAIRGLLATARSVGELDELDLLQLEEDMEEKKRKGQNNIIDVRRLMDPKLSDDDFLVIVRHLNDMKDQKKLIELLKQSDADGFSVLNHIRRRIRLSENRCSTLFAAANEMHPTNVHKEFIRLANSTDNKNWAEVARLVKEGVDVNRNIECLAGHSLLDHAVFKQTDVNVVRALVISGAPVNRAIREVEIGSQMRQALRTQNPTQLIASPRLNSWSRAAAPSTTGTGNNNNNDKGLGQGK